MKWFDIFTKQKPRFFILLPTVVIAIYAMITYFLTTNDALTVSVIAQKWITVLVVSWFFIGVLIVSLQVLYVDHYLGIASLLMACVIIGTMLTISGLSDSYRIFIMKMIGVIFISGYIIGLMTTIIAVKSELKRKKINRISRRDLLMLLIPFGISWFIFSVLAYFMTNAVQPHVLMMATSAVIVAIYAIFSGYWGGLPVSIITITSLSLWVFLIFSLVQFPGIGMFLAVLNVGFLVIFETVYFSKYHYNKNKAS